MPPTNPPSLAPNPNRTGANRPIPPNPLPVKLIGTENSDTLSGDNTDNAYSAGAGNDLLRASGGNDTFSGGAGVDILDYTGVNADLTLSRGGRLSKSGGMGVDTIANFDIEVIRANPNRSNTIDGATGTTAWLDVNLSTKSLIINNLPGIGSARLTVENFQNVNGSENADVIVGDDTANTLNGLGGNDSISAGGGDDKLVGSSGSDIYRGGLGFDTLSYSGLGQGITLTRGGTITKADGSVDTIADFSVEAIEGAKGLINTIDGSTGTTASIAVDLSKESLVINNLPVIGTANLAVKYFTDVRGSENADQITGNAGTNALSGGGGNDVLTGLGGADRLTGGSGNDTFVFGRGDSQLNGFDWITDLQIGSDVIDAFVTNGTIRQLGSVGELTGAVLGQFLSAQSFLADSAASFTVGSGSAMRTFLAFNDNQRGFQANSDSLVEITGYSGQLSQLQLV
jgi:Ca2+-binding RTX toxin-like protein